MHIDCSKISACILALPFLLSACAQSIATQGDYSFIDGIEVGMPALEMQRAIEHHYPNQKIDVFDHQEAIQWIMIEVACAQRNACTPSNLQETLSRRVYQAGSTSVSKMVPGIAIKEELRFPQGFDEISMLAVFLDENHGNVIGYIASGDFLND